MNRGRCAAGREGACGLRDTEGQGELQVEAADLEALAVLLQAAALLAVAALGVLC